MANFTVTDFVTDEDSVEAVMAALEVKIDTLDSTNNAIYLVKIFPLPNGKFIGVLMYE